MDDATSRPRPPSRRMASAKPATTTRQTSSSKSPKKKGDEPEVSPARWAGVALVLVAIVAAILLAVFSPSEPGETAAEIAVEPTAEPSPTVLDTRVPVALPRITNPVEGTTKELDVPVTVELPEEALPRRLLRLYVLRGEEVVGELDRPKAGGSVVVGSARLAPGLNVLTAALSGPGGFGPRSVPVLVTVDRDAPDLAITSPQNKYATYDDQVRVEGTSEVGADVVVRNEANDFRQSATVGNSGEFAITVRLKRNANRIVASSKDDAAVTKTDTVRVIRLDGRPSVKVKDIDPIRRSALPTDLRIVVDVTDVKGKPMPGAEVYYSLGAPDRTSQTETGLTDDSGRSVWKPTVEASSSSTDALELLVKVTSSLSDDSKTVTRKIDFR